MHDPGMRTTESDTNKREQGREEKKNIKEKRLPNTTVREIVPEPLSKPARLSIRICRHNAASVSAKLLAALIRQGRDRRRLFDVIMNLTSTLLLAFSPWLATISRVHSVHP